MLKVWHPDAMTFYFTTCYFFVKFVSDLYITELPPISSLYYKHDSQWTGFFLLISIVYVVPGSLAPMIIVRWLQDRYIFLIGLVITIIGALIKLNYKYDQPQPMYQYYVGSIVFFIGTLVFEASCIALLGKVISPRLKMSFWNAGLLAGCTDTAGRALGNGTYTIIAQYISKASVTFYAYIIDLIIVVPILVISIIFIRRMVKIVVMKVKDISK